MGKLFRFILGAGVGLAVGAAIAIVAAPQSGEELRRKLDARRREAAEAAKSAMSARERELRAEWESKVDALAIKRRAMSQ